MRYAIKEYLIEYRFYNFSINELSFGTMDPFVRAEVPDVTGP